MTPAWMSGYAGDVVYTLGFYRELAPSFLSYICAVNGIDGPAANRRLRYCELGCGRGYGTVLLAAANPDIDFVGIDFNPAHVGEARALATEASLANVTFHELSFADAARAADPELADFDIVAAHGVFSWVSEAVRRDIITFLAAKLVPGGIAYVSYNCLPGWAAAAPIQHILKEFADRGTGDSFARLDRGLAVLKELTAKSAAYITQNPTAKGRIDFVEKQDRAYLVGEYLNDHWQPIYVDQAFAALAEAKLTFVASANIAENRLALCVPQDLIEYVNAMPDVALHELLKDYALNKQFRRDVYVKGPRRLSGEEARRRSRGLTFALVARPDPLPEKWPIPAGEATIKPEIVHAIVDRLQDGPATAADLLAAATAAGVSEANVAPTTEILVHAGIIMPARGDGAGDATAAWRLNQVVFDAALHGDTHRYVAAPALGSAIATTYFERLAAPLVCDNPQADSESVASLMFDRLEGTGRVVRRGDKPIKRDAEGLAEIARLVETFRAQALPLWRRLGVIG